LISGDKSAIRRRSLAGILGGVLPAEVAAPAQAVEQSGNKDFVTVGLLKDLGVTEVPAGALRIRTLGHTRPGVGGADYEPAATGGPHRLRSANGIWWVLAADQIVTPDRFGALPDANALPALQRAVDFIEEERGRGVLDLASGRYACAGGPLVIDPVRAGLRGNGGQLTFESSAPAAILCRPRPGTPQYGHAAFAWEGFELVGPGPDSSMDGILFDTPTPGFSSRVLAVGLAIHGFRSGLKMANRAYGLKFIGLDVYGCGTCVEFPSHTEDSGENISFVSCSLFNSRLAVLNNGAGELFFFGCSLDYCTRLFIGSGLATFIGCHFEIAQPSAADQIPFELTDVGDLVIDGGTLLISGVNFEHGGVQSYMFLTHNRSSRVWLRNVNGYNWRTASGALLGGAGRIVCEGLTGSANRQIPAVTKRDSVHNLFGAGGNFQGPAIAVDCWVEGGTRRINRYSVAWENAGQEYARADLAISDRFAAQGKHSLRFARKGVGGGTSSAVYLAAPIRAGASAGLEFNWRMPLGLGGAGAAMLYFQMMFVRIIGVDGAGIPLLGETLLLGEANPAVSLSAGMPAFEKIGFTTTYSDHTSPCDGYAPEWATHLLLMMNPINMPSGTEIFIAELAAYSL
jgi:hypothetical protein